LLFFIFDVVIEGKELDGEDSGAKIELCRRNFPERTNVVLSKTLTETTSKSASGNAARAKLLHPAPAQLRRR
jgi:hypothetical protein